MLTAHHTVAGNLRSGAPVRGEINPREQPVAGLASSFAQSTDAESGVKRPSRKPEAGSSRWRQCATALRRQRRLICRSAGIFIGVADNVRLRCADRASVPRFGTAQAIEGKDRLGINIGVIVTEWVTNAFKAACGLSKRPAVRACAASRMARPNFRWRMMKIGQHRGSLEGHRPSARGSSTRWPVPSVAMSPTSRREAERVARLAFTRALETLT